MLISQQAAADELGLSKQSFQNKKRIHKKKTGKEFGFLKKNDSGVWKVDNEHPEWLIFKTGYAAKGAAAEMKRQVMGEERKPEKKTSLALKNLSGGRYFKGALRNAILKRDGYKCQLCGKSIDDGIRLEVDHIVEFEDGGETTYDNGQTICSECNKEKSAAKKINKEDEQISITEFAKRVGVHRNTISEAIKNGIIEYDTINGKINYTTEIIKWYSQDKISKKKSLIRKMIQKMRKAKAE